MLDYCKMLSKFICDNDCYVKECIEEHDSVVYNEYYIKLCKIFQNVSQNSLQSLYNLLIDVSSKRDIVFSTFMSVPMFAHSKDNKKLTIYFYFSKKVDCITMAHEIGHLFEYNYRVLQKDSEFKHIFDKFFDYALIEFEQNKQSIRQYLIDNYLLANHREEYANYKRYQYIIKEYLKCKDKSRYYFQYSQKFQAKIGLGYYEKLGKLIAEEKLIERYTALRRIRPKKFLDEFTTLGDVCGAYKAIKYFINLPTHPKFYYKDKNMIPCEMFANLFASRLNNINADYAHTKIFFPKTCVYFDQIYDAYLDKYIMRNGFNFSQLKLKQVA